MKRCIPKILILVIVLIFSVPNNYTKAVNLTDVISGGEQFLRKGENVNQELFEAQKEQEAVDQVYFILLGIAIIAAFIVGTVLGIQFITSGAAGQAKVKEKLIPFVVGLFVVFGGFGIWKIALSLGRSLLEAPPAYLTSSDEVKFVFSRSGDSKTWRNASSGASTVETHVEKEVNVYITETDKIELPIAYGKIKLSFDDDYERVGNIVQKAREGVHVWVDPDSVQGCGNYTASYDEATSTITFKYKDLSNVPNVTEGTNVCKFNIVMEEEVSFGTDRASFTGKDRTMTEGTYYVYMDSVECYDKDNNNISKNVNHIETPYEYEITYKQEVDNYYEEWSYGW